MTNDPAAVPFSSPEAPQPGAPAAPLPPRHTIFTGPNGLRSGWRALLFLVFTTVFVFVFSIPLVFLAQRGGNGRPAPVNSLTPLGTGLSEAAFLLASLLAALLMSVIERGKFANYGLPFRFAFRKDFWIGASAGFAAISACLLVIFACHGFHLNGIAIHGKTLLGATAAWSLAFVIVGLSEEFTFRGYVQYTLTSGIGFWPSAVLLSLLFGAVHAGNPGETRFGLAQVVLFGLLFCLFLRRTGNLWLAVGFHAGWDWGQTFFYGVPDSGLPAYHSLFTSSFSGPRWLTGGSVGPEASVVTPLVLAAVALVFSRLYRQALSPDRERALDAAAGVSRPGPE